MNHPGRESQLTPPCNPYLSAYGIKPGVHPTGKEAEVLAPGTRPLSRTPGTERSVVEGNPGPSATSCEAPHQPHPELSAQKSYGPIRLTVVSPLAGRDPAD